MSKVLIIEDDREISDLISIHLKDMEMEVRQSFDGKDGLMQAMNQAFDLIVLDLRLPYLDGLELCRKIPHLICYDFSSVILLIAYNGRFVIQSSFR